MIRSPDLPVPRSPVRAVVHAAGFATAYQRVGRGAPLVLLVERGWSEPLVRRLAAAARVIVPEVPALKPAATDPSGRVAFIHWLRDFLDGLGIERAALAAGTGHGPAALAFALLEGDRVERLLLLEEGDVEGDDADLTGRVACPSLRLRAATGSAEALDAASRFLLDTD